MTRPEPEFDEKGNPIHKTDGEVLAYIRETAENPVLREWVIGAYWNQRAMGVDINEARHNAIWDVFKMMLTGGE